MNKSGLILFAHGARDVRWARPIERIAEAVRVQGPGQVVRVAYLEFMAPTLEDVVDEMAAEGLRQMVIVPVFMAEGGHLRHDLPDQVTAAKARWPDVQIEIATASGEAQAVVDAIAAYALGCLAR